MDTPTTGITDDGTNRAEPDMAEASTASRTADGGSLNTNATRQDWLEILLSVAAERLEIPVARLRLRDGLVYALILRDVVQDENGDFVFV